MRYGLRTFLGGLLLAGLVNAASASAAEVALLYSNYQEERFRYMPGEYDAQYGTAGATVKEAGFEWDRVGSKPVESDVADRGLHGREAGRVQRVLRILSDGGAEVARLSVSVDVAPIALAPRNRHDLLTTVWDYRVSGCMHGSLAGFGAGRVPEADARTFLRWNEHYDRHFREHWCAYIRDLEEHGVNVMFLATGICLPSA